MLTIRKTFTILILAALPLTGWATNGMNMEGYGPVSLSMGGTSMAFDNGTAALMNNPATLMLQESDMRLDVAFGFLGPDVRTQAPDGEVAKSNADAFFMPALGYIVKKNDLAFGIGIFGQGGMGTEYSSKSFLAIGSDKPIRSEVSVGRVIIPVAWQVNEKLSLAVTADIVWAGMDMQMAMNNSQFTDLTTPGQQHMGNAYGTLLNAMGNFMMAGYTMDYNYFDFSNDSPFTGEARGLGTAFKLGLLYKVNDQLTLGASYHSKTALSDLDSSNAALAFQMSNDTPPPGYPNVFPAEVTGKIEVVDFEWPCTVAAGFAYDLNKSWKLTGDVKYICWSDTMDKFQTRFTVNDSASNDMTAMGGGDLRGANLDCSLNQKWDDQAVLSVGLAYEQTYDVIWRCGINYADNPVPDRYLNPLFPATVELHLTGGMSWKVSDNLSVDFGMVYAPDSKNSIPTPVGNIENSHGQINAQILSSWKF